ncbi:MAG: FadR/GntR family transcriptional regulator [Treponemataceae bacterium]
MNRSDENVTKEDGERSVLEHIQALLSSGSLKPGDKLPSERQLSELFGATRGYVRKALQRLEYYGLVRTLPQKGTVVERIGGKAMSGIIQAIIEIDGAEDIDSLMDTRSILERHSARQAAERATIEGLASIRDAHMALKTAAEAGKSTLEEDHLFHLAIARACGNGVTLSLIGIMTPKIIAMNRDFTESDPGRAQRTFAEHQMILDAIAMKDPESAEKAMRTHMEKSKFRRLIK